MVYKKLRFFFSDKLPGEPSAIASVAAFLLSDDAILITGTDIYADGGYLAMGSEGLGEASNFAGSV